ncbi:hypothetical protein H2200_005974 [Cladophialophora chaetospira]|uniref:Uncharacterized protein n=1 Tax=Cladophialophora chaetospira TaxID=386627 RepID=A0AA39CIM2_9EURO|nr:hypothetical protein H2200_005974 [Cladophialophora chaetospira]
MATHNGDTSGAQAKKVAFNLDPHPDPQAQDPAKEHRVPSPDAESGFKIDLPFPIAEHLRALPYTIYSNLSDDHLSDLSEIVFSEHALIAPFRQAAAEAFGTQTWEHPGSVPNFKSNDIDIKGLAAAHLARLPGIERMIDARVDELKGKLVTKGEHPDLSVCEMYWFRQVLECRLRAEYGLGMRSRFRRWMGAFLEEVQTALLADAKEHKESV